MLLCNDTLGNHYKMNFALMQHHGYSLTELDEMLPFEREVYISLLIEFLEEEKKRVQRNPN